MTPLNIATSEDRAQAPDVYAGNGDRDADTGEWAARGWLELKGLLTTIVLLVVFDMAVVTSHVLVNSRVIVVGLALFLPGATVLAATGVRLTNPFSHLVGVFGAGTAVWMAWVALSSAALFPLGVSDPLDALPLMVGINVVILVALLLRPSGADPVWDLLRPNRARPSVIVGLVGALLPLSAVAAAERLNGGFGGAAAAAVTVAALAVLVLVLIRAPNWPDGRAQYLLFSAALTLIYLYTWRSNHLFGFDVQQEYQRFTVTLETGRWVPPSNGDPYAAMLSITALPAALVKVSGLGGLTLFKTLYPFYLATVPPLTYGLVRIWLPSRPAAVSVTYLIALTQFADQLSGISRQEVGLFYFNLLLLVLFDPQLDRRRRTGTAIVALAALVVSHYSTSYVTVFVLVGTWILFGLVRLLRRGPSRRVPDVRVSMVVAGAGVVFIWLWDLVITRSAHNLTSIVAAFADDGPNLLPNRGSSPLTTWLSGNVTNSVSPAEYYRLAYQASLTEHWLHRYPSTLTSHFPAATVSAASASPTGPFFNLSVLVSELFLVATVVGAVLLLLDRSRKSGVPLEYGLLAAVMLVFVAVARVSGTLATAYNQERAQIQAGMVLAVALALVVDRCSRRLRGAVMWSAVIGIVLLAIGSTGLANPDRPTLTNSGQYYDAFYMSDQDVAAAHWMVGAAGPRPLLWTDEYGELRIWAGSGYPAGTQRDLTPETLDQSAWVLATGYNVAGRAYGASGEHDSTYRFPADFLARTKAIVYSSPHARVYR